MRFRLKKLTISVSVLCGGGVSPPVPIDLKIQRQRVFIWRFNPEKNVFQPYNGQARFIEHKLAIGFFFF